MAPKCCSCSSSGVCKACSCARGRRRCLDCAPSKYSRCANIALPGSQERQLQSTSTSTRPVTAHNRAIPMSSVSSIPSIPSSCSSFSSSRSSVLASSSSLSSSSLSSSSSSTSCRSSATKRNDSMAGSGEKGVGNMHPPAARAASREAAGAATASAKQRDAISATAAAVGNTEQPVRFDQVGNQVQSNTQSDVGADSGQCSFLWPSSSSRQLNTAELQSGADTAPAKQRDAVSADPTIAAIGNAHRPLSSPEEVRSDRRATIGQLLEYKPSLTTNFRWGRLTGTEFAHVIQCAYSEIAHWRRNTFMVPSGKAGKQFVQELTALFNAYAQGSALESVALTSVMVACALLLQKPHPTSKCWDHVTALERQLSAWRDGMLTV